MWCARDAHGINAKIGIILSRKMQLIPCCTGCVLASSLTSGLSILMPHQIPHLQETRYAGIPMDLNVSSALLSYAAFTPYIHIQM